ncbi:MAG: trypsin-like peptidase domain-containing protein, partial [Desulfuromonadales bacterium]
VAKAGPAVVNIRTEQIIQRRASPFFGFGDAFFDDFFRQFSQPRSYRTQALGSGAIFDSRGYLVTNAHVVEKASKIFVALPDQPEELEATLVGIDPATDLAVVKVVSKKPLPSLSLSDNDDLMLGEAVIAIGNPLGLENSVTTGVVSAPRRRLPDGEGGLGIFIQTDALINPGNSGGPLLDINGRLIGINTAIAQQAQGIGFAIPVKIVRRVVDDLIAYGHVRPVYTGIFPGEISRAMVRSRGAGGVLVTDLEPDSPAAEAGVKPADVILDLDGVQTDSVSEYLSLLHTYSPGSRVLLTMLRGVEQIPITFKLTELPDGYAEHYLQRIFGLIVDQDDQGVYITRVLQNSPAAQIELRPGDRITELEGIRVENLQAFFAGIETSLGHLPLRFSVFRGNRGYLVEMP